MIKNFEVTSVELSKSNLIEASAGTGKTYSIAILVLRLVIEKGISIKEILMVTFTKAAVAELEERIRIFLKSALLVAENKKISDTLIQKIVEDYIIKTNRNLVLNRLKNAVLSLDESSVLTIHSFCQNTLSEFAFETNQLFDSETIENSDEIIEKQVNEIWRNYISILETDLLLKINPKLNKTEVSEYVKKVLSGKKYLKHEGTIDNLVTDRTIQRNVAAEIQDDSDILNCIHSVYQFIVPIICNNLMEYKKRENIISFDDMIFDLHKAIVSENSIGIKKGLRQKFKAVFVDEFQDTDKYQYDIFNHAFANSDTLLFYIGDPKQSIYGFRSADIFTYFKAASNVDNQFNMNINFRSSINYIKAMNVFFIPKKGFDAFGFKNSNFKIDYIPVESPVNNKKGELYFKEKPVIPIEIILQKNKNTVNLSIVDVVHDLLTNPEYKIIKNKKARKLLPADIGIIVHKNTTAGLIKKALIKKGIYSVTIDESKIIKSSEAVNLLYVMSAIYQNNWSNICKALLTDFTSYKREDIIQLNEEELLLKFSHYKKVWESHGIYNSLNSFLNDFNVRAYLLNIESREGMRKLSNTIQLIELLNEIEKRKLFNQQELLHWLATNIKNPSSDASAYSQRIESDEEAVKIVTIHKSKGLEYNIVLATELDFTASTDGLETFRNEADETYYFGHSGFFTDDQINLTLEQKEQEYRRLIYVAITRAVYKSYIFKSDSNTLKNSSIAQFINAQQFDKHKELILLSNPNNSATSGSYFPEWRPFEPLTVSNFELNDINWRKLSYSAISVKDEQSVKHNQSICTDDYSKFIFKDLPKGSTCGNMLHYIFENIDFIKPDTFETVINKSIHHFYPKYSGVFNQLLLQLIDHTLNTPLKVGNHTFSLSQIESAKRINEMEFDFTFPELNLSKLSELSKPGRKILVKDLGNFKGYMNGKIDLFFECQNKFYILDWKSNFLGDTIELYDNEHVSKAMSESNYHLQYLIYSIAVKKYLSARIPDFNYNKHFGGVIYLFLRGVRKNSDCGIFTTKPAEDDVLFLENLLSNK